MQLFLLLVGVFSASELRLPRAFSSFVAGVLVSSNAVQALDVPVKTYENARYHTSVNYPSDWEARVGAVSGDRVVEAFIDPNDPETSASLVFTPIPADYSRISAFGGKENLRDYMVPKGEGVTTEIVSESLKGEAYSVEYIVTLPEGITRHVQTVFALRPQESVVGLTVQTREDTYAKNKDKLAVIVPSLRVDLE